ncbi:MAG: TIGR01777 family oxidoreductase [Pseudomonadales bacterium]
MKLVIAGGSGLIGQALARQAVALSHEVVVLSRRPMPAALAGRGVIWDGEQPGDWVAELNDAQVVINLCGANIGQGRWTESRKAEIRQSRIAPAQCLVSVMQAQANKPVYLQASAVGFYGPGDTPVDEESPAGDDYLARLAIEWEAQADAYSGPTTITRFGVVLAADAGALPLMALPFKLFVGGKLGRGEQYFAWITVTDVAGALLFCIEQALRGVVNLVAPQTITNAEFTRAMASAVGRPAVFTVPAFVLRTVLGEQADLMLQGQQVLPSRLQDAGYRFADPEIAPALQRLLG